MVSVQVCAMGCVQEMMCVCWGSWGAGLTQPIWVAFPPVTVVASRLPRPEPQLWVSAQCKADPSPVFLSPPWLPGPRIRAVCSGPPWGSGEHCLLSLQIGACTSSLSLSTCHPLSYLEPQVTKPLEGCK